VNFIASLFFNYNMGVMGAMGKFHNPLIQ